MIVYHAHNVAGKRVQHNRWHFFGQVMHNWAVAETSTAPTGDALALARNKFRFVFSRVFGRVN